MIYSNGETLRTHSNSGQFQAWALTSENETSIILSGSRYPSEKIAVAMNKGIVKFVFIVCVGDTMVTPKLRTEQANLKIKNFAKGVCNLSKLRIWARPHRRQLRNKFGDRLCVALLED